MYNGPPSYGPTANMNYGPKRKQMRATQVRSLSIQKHVLLC